MNSLFTSGFYSVKRNASLLLLLVKELDQHIGD